MNVSVMNGSISDLNVIVFLLLHRCLNVLEIRNCCGQRKLEVSQ